MTGAWTRAFLDALGAARASDTSTVAELRIEPALISAQVDGRQVTVSAAPIAPGIWAAIEASITTDRQSEQLAQLLDHTWEEPLVPREIVKVGRNEDVAAVAHAVADVIEREPVMLLRWRGYRADPAEQRDQWRGGPLPKLPPPARRPPESAPKRFGASGIATADGDLVETLIRAYVAFGEQDV